MYVWALPATDCSRSFWGEAIPLVWHVGDPDRKFDSLPRKMTHLYPFVHDLPTKHYVSSSQSVKVPKGKPHCCIQHCIPTIYLLYIYPTIPHDIPIYPLYFMLSHSPWVKTSPGRNTKSMRRSGYAWGRRAGRVAAAWPKSWASWLHQCPTTTAVSREFQWPFQVLIYWRYLPYTRPM